MKKYFGLSGAEPTDFIIIFRLNGIRLTGIRLTGFRLTGDSSIWDDDTKLTKPTENRVFDVMGKWNTHPTPAATKTRPADTATNADTGHIKDK